jgi:hypothetical protein
MVDAGVADLCGVLILSTPEAGAGQGYVEPRSGNVGASPGFTPGLARVFPDDPYPIKR